MNPKHLDEMKADAERTGLGLALLAAKQPFQDQELSNALELLAEDVQADAVGLDPQTQAAMVAYADRVGAFVTGLTRGLLLAVGVLGYHCGLRGDDPEAAIRLVIEDRDHPQ